MSARRDALLAAVALAATLAFAAAAGVGVSVAAAVAGGAAVPLVEVLAGRRATAVRRRWEHPLVQLLALAAVVAVAALAALADARPVLSAVAGGLGTYLLLLALVQFGVASPPENWWPE